MRRADEVAILKRLAFLVEGNVALLDACTILSSSVPKKYEHLFKTACGDLLNGASLSQALHKNGIVGAFSRVIISIAEKSGQLAATLGFLTTYLEKRTAVKKKITSALVYPFVVGSATAGITAMLMFYVFPKIMPVLVSMNGRLPATTRLLIWFVTFVKNDGIWAIFALAALAAMSISAYRRSQRVRYSLEALELKLPPVRRIVNVYFLSHIARTLALFSQGGVGLPEALTSIEVNNEHYKKSLTRTSANLNRGVKLAESLAEEPALYPALFVALVRVAEASGNLEEAFSYMSTLYENEMDNLIKTFTTLIEPLLMVVMGSLVGFVAISIISPIYSLTQTMQH